MISRTGVLPTDQRFRDLSANEELLRFTAYWLNKKEDDFFSTWARMLGVVWTRDQVKQMVEAGPKAVGPKEMFIPHALAVNGELYEALKKTFRIHKGKFIGGGEYHSDKGEEVVEMGDMPIEEFLQFANQATGVMQESAEEFKRQHDVTIKEGPSADPRLDRIREQIAHSKRR